MTEWEEMKRAGQTAFIGLENGFNNIHESIRGACQQILSTGHISPSMGEGSLTQQIAEGNFREPEPQQPEIFYSRDQEQGIEPER